MNRLITRKFMFIGMLLGFALALYQNGGYLADALGGGLVWAVVFGLVGYFIDRLVGRT